MNQTFSVSRFLLLVKVEFAEKSHTQVLTAGLLLAFLLLFMLPIIFFDGFRTNLSELHPLALIMVVLFGGSIYTDLAFSQYGPREKSMVALMVPASRLEKFLAPLVLNLIVIVPLIVLFLCLHDWTVDYANAKIPATDQQYRKLPLPLLQVITLFYIVIQGVVFFGSLYFTKSSYIKTVMASILVILVLVVANWAIVNSLLADANPSSISALPFSDWNVQFETPKYKVFRVKYFDAIQSFMYLLPALITVSLWYITYVRLKEKEI